MSKQIWGAYIVCRITGLICFLTLGIVCSDWAQAISNDYPELQHPPHPRYLLASLQIATVIGCVGIGWIPLSGYFILRHFCSEGNVPRVLLVLVDSIITVGLAMAAKLQAEFLPKPVGQCEDINQIRPKPEKDGEEGQSFMDIMAQTPVGKEDLPMTSWEFCASFCMVFRMEIAAAFVSGVAAIVVVWFLVLNNTYRWDWLAKWEKYFRRCRIRREKERKKRKKRDECDKAEQGFAGRIWTRTIALGNNIAGKKNEPPSQSPPSSGELYLSRLLCTYSTSQSLVSTLHTTDILSLALASPLLNQSLRTSFTPQNLSLQTCLLPQPSEKSTCYSCSIQLCPTCTHTRFLYPPFPFHTTTCKPYCASCYRNTICTTATLPTVFDPISIDKWKKTKVCGCGAGGQDWRKNLCRLCFKDTDNVVILRAEKRKEAKEWRARFAGVVSTTEGVEVGKKSGGGGDKGVWCWGCERHMSKRDRVWWVCLGCKGECLNLQHYE